MANAKRQARTAEEREAFAIDAAYSLAEKQLANGTASATVITHFLKLATEREKRELERLKNENLLLQTRNEQIKTQTNLGKVYEEALQAMKRYSGQVDE